PTLIATLSSTAVAIAAAFFFASRDSSWRVDAASHGEEPLESSASESDSITEESYQHLIATRRYGARLIAWLLPAGLIGALIYRLLGAENLFLFMKDEVATWWLMPALMLFILSYGIGRGVKVYEAVTEGAKQGFEIAIRIIPFLVAILVAIGMFRASGAMDILATVINPITSLLGLPAEVLPMAILRPLSGSGAFAVMSALVNEAPNSYSSFLSSVMMGSTETTFYVLAVYFGAVGITRIRHALSAAICADITGVLVSCLVSPFFF
ncbi:MAG: spore maturation protein, partial [Bdellovibrionales bacterium]|nr:spore maturation protein [Bdellovibrionales bacterium]